MSMIGAPFPPIARNAVIDRKFDAILVELREIRKQLTALEDLAVESSEPDIRPNLFIEFWSGAWQWLKDIFRPVVKT
jgi:hypothetical protein